MSVFCAAQGRISPACSVQLKILEVPMDVFVCMFAFLLFIYLSKINVLGVLLQIRNYCNLNKPLRFRLVIDF